VDEFQDTNAIQYALARLMGQRGLTVVGDPDQSIYGFRNAEPGVFDRVLREHPADVTAYLNQNYRSTKNILDFSCAVIANAVPPRDGAGDPPRLLWTAHAAGPKVVFITADSTYDEGTAITNEIWRMARLSGGRLTLRDCAVLIRTKAMSAAFQQSCSRAGLPYHLVHGGAFIDRPEVKDLTAFLRVLVDPNDVQSLARIVNVVTRGESVIAAEEKLRECANHVRATWPDASYLHALDACLWQLRETCVSLCVCWCVCVCVFL
jgi:DNA helicase-2/ATP-dependent DNA helicase PcrA